MVALFTVPACGRPDVEHAIFEYDDYLVAGTVKFTGCEDGYQLRGTTSFRCETDEDKVASWQPDIREVECKCKSYIVITK